jgi:hypothetical protein
VPTWLIRCGLHAAQVRDVFKDVAGPDDDESDEAITKRVSELRSFYPLLHVLSSV